MTAYITVDQLNQYMGVPASTLDQPMLLQAVNAASRRVNKICGRYFTLDAQVTAKLFRPLSWWECEFIDTAGQRWDLSTTTGLIVQADRDYSGSYGSTLTLNTDFMLNPENGYKNGEPWPYEGMTALGNPNWLPFPPFRPGYRAPIKVTGKWGWPAVPDDVVSACLILAKQLYMNKDNVGGFIGFESGAVRVREDPLALTYLEPFAQTTRMVA